LQLSGTIGCVVAELLDLTELLDAVTELLESATLLLDAIIAELLELIALLLNAIAELLNLAELLRASELLEATVLLLGSFGGGGLSIELLLVSKLPELVPISCPGLELQAKNKDVDARVAKKSNILGKYVRIFIPPE